jgi:hypothetical protein
VSKASRHDIAATLFWVRTEQHINAPVARFETWAGQGHGTSDSLLTYSDRMLEWFCGKWQSEMCIYMHWENWEKKDVQWISSWYSDGVLDRFEQSGT